MERLAAGVGSDSISFSDSDRFACARDLWPRHLIRMEAGVEPRLPDAVLLPGDTAAVARAVTLCGELGISLVPYGAGSSVVGGATPENGEVVLDLKRLNRVLEIDVENQVVRAQAGVMGELLERELNRAGYTQGHFPSSMYCTTVGGWVAARSAGQMSSRFGKIEDQVVGGTVVLGDGSCLRQGPVPGRCGPLADLVGCEGTLGIWTEAVMRIHPLPEVRAFRGLRFPDLERALDAAKRWLEAGISPSVIRIYDPLDTLLHKEAHRDAVRGDRGPSTLAWAGAAFPRLLNRVGNRLASECRVIVGLEGRRPVVDLELSTILKIAAGYGAEDLGEGPGNHWYQKRYAVSYRQSNALRAGVLPDTMEVACTWDNVLGIYGAVCAAALDQRASVLAHFSHLYLDGASIYFTFAMPLKIGESGYLQLWDAVLGAAVEAGANVSHHHGIGRLKAGALNGVWGGQRHVYEQLRRLWDPADSLNPGLFKAEDQWHPGSARVGDCPEMVTCGPEERVAEVERRLGAQGRTLGEAAALFAEVSVGEALRTGGLWRVDPQLGIGEPALHGVDGSVEGDPCNFIPAPRGAQGVDLTSHLLDHSVTRLWLRTELPSESRVFYPLPGAEAVALARAIVQSGQLRNCKVNLIKEGVGWTAGVALPPGIRAAVYLEEIKRLGAPAPLWDEGPGIPALPRGATFLRCGWSHLSEVLRAAEKHGAEVTLPWVDPAGVAGFLTGPGAEAMEALLERVAGVVREDRRTPELAANEGPAGRETAAPAGFEGDLVRVSEHVAALDNCTYCPKLCRFSCPVAVAEGREALIPRQLMLSVNLHRRGERPLNEDTALQLWSCVDCGACTEFCEHGNPVSEVLVAARADLVDGGVCPRPVASALGAFIEEGTLTGDPAGDRPGAELLGDGPDSDTWLFLGCQGSAEKEKHNLAALALARRRFGRVHVISEGPRCCGGPLKRWGEESAFKTHLLTLRSAYKGVIRLVVDDRGCGEVLRDGWGDIGGGPEVVSIWSLLLDSEWTIPDPGRWAPHDCCARPRGEQGLRSLPGGEGLAVGSVMEGVGGSCGGALARHLDPAAADRIARRCGEDLIGGGAQGILVESPTCRRRLEEAGFAVDDLLEVWLDFDTTNP